MKSNNTKEARELLTNNKSSSRKKGAKMLRKSPNQDAVPDLMLALEKEVENVKTWETQYHLVMALGESNAIQAIPILQKMADSETLSRMVKIAIGDSITRLLLQLGRSYDFIIKNIKSQNLPLLEGAFRAIAMTKAIPDASTILSIIEFVSLPENERVRLWVAAASPGWNHDLIEPFLNLCLASNHKDVVKAASAAKKSKYLNWKPL